VIETAGNLIGAGLPAGQVQDWIDGLLEKHGASLVQSGAVAWQFNRWGVIRLAVPKNEELELQLIDLGVEDIKEEEGGLTLLVKPEQLQKILNGLTGLKLTPEYQALEWLAKEPVSVADQSARIKLDELYAALEEMDDTQSVWSNLGISDEAMAALESA